MSSFDDGTSTSRVASLSEVLEFVNAAESRSDSTRVPVKVNFLRNFTIEGIEPLLKYHCLKSGLKPGVTFGNYDMVRQEVLDKTSHIYADAPDIIVVALYLETYLSDRWLSGWNAGEVMNDLARLFSDIARNTDAIIAVNTFIPPFYSDWGITNSEELPSHYHEVLQLNQLVREFVRSTPSRFVLMEWERFVRLLGRTRAWIIASGTCPRLPSRKAFSISMPASSPKSPGRSRADRKNV